MKKYLFLIFILALGLNAGTINPPVIPQDSTSADSINSGTLSGDRLPAMSATKRGAVPATGTPSGLFLKDDGTWAAGGSGGGDGTISNSIWHYITASQTAVRNQGYMLYAHDAEIDLTLPSSPAIGDSVSVRVLDLTLACWLYSADNIEGSAAHLQIDTPNFYGTFTYSDAAFGWVKTK